MWIEKLRACNASLSYKREKHSPTSIDIVFSASSSSNLLIKKRRINKFICLKQHSQKSNERPQAAHSTAILNSRGFVRERPLTKEIRHVRLIFAYEILLAKYKLYLILMSF